MTIVIDDRESYGVLSIVRPERRNALNSATLDELGAALETATAAGWRALILMGSAGHFCAGADLTELEDREFTVRLRVVLNQLIHHQAVTIADIAGSCMGLGMQLASACDVRVVHDTAKFAIPIAKLGLMVDRETLLRVAETFGAAAARQMALCADILDADDAFRYGFAQWRGADNHSAEIAKRIVALAPLSIQGTKEGLNSLHLEEDPRYEAAFVRAWESADLVEGQAAFNERRPPQFTGQ